MRHWLELNLNEEEVSIVAQMYHRALNEQNGMEKDLSMTLSPIDLNSVPFWSLGLLTSFHCLF